MKSVGNLKKITRALEVVSTVKLQKIKDKADQQKEYILDLINIVSTTWSISDLFENDSIHPKYSDRALHIVVTSERWLCGWLNSKLLRKSYNDMNQNPADVFVVGKKWLEFYKRVDAEIVWSVHVPDSFDQESLLPLYTFFDQAIESKKYTSIYIYYNYFKNSIVQVPTAMQVYPFTSWSFTTLVSDLEIETMTSIDAWEKDLLVEPSAQEFATEARRQLRNVVLSSTILQNKAGEHASRMIAMKNAKDNATTMWKKLKQTFNKARQWAITQEISEIVSAKIAIWD